MKTNTASRCWLWDEIHKARSGRKTLVGGKKPASVFMFPLTHLKHSNPADLQTTPLLMWLASSENASSSFCSAWLCIDFPRVSFCETEPAALGEACLPDQITSLAVWNTPAWHLLSEEHHHKQKFFSFYRRSARRNNIKSLMLWYHLYILIMYPHPPHPGTVNGQMLSSQLCSN